MQRLRGLLCATLRMRPLPCFTCTDQQLLMCLLPAQIVELKCWLGCCTHARLERRWLLADMQEVACTCSSHLLPARGLCKQVLQLSPAILHT